jgi:hypothetical protein
MVPFMRPTAGALAGVVARLPTPPKRVLDIAAGHGVFGISVAQAVPQAEITAVDWQAVLEVAHENASAAGISDRYRTVPGSAFEVYWGRDFDLVLLTNFLHHTDWCCCKGQASKQWQSGFSTPLLYRRDLRLSVTVNEPNVAQIVASVVHGAA